MSAKYDASHFAFAGYAYTESLCNALIVKGVMSEAEKKIILQLAIQNLKASSNEDFHLAAELLKEMNSHMQLDDG